MGEAVSYPELIADDPDAYWMTPARVETQRLIEAASGYLERPDYVVDIGAGDCYFSRKIHAEFDTEVVALDVNLSALEAGPKLHLMGSDGTTAIRDGSVDGMFYINSLQAVKGPRQELESAYRALEDGGVALVTGPTGESAEVFPEKARDYSTDPPRVVGKMIEGVEDYSQHFFPEGWISETAESVGFDVSPQGSVLTDIRGLPHLYSHIQSDYRPEVDKNLLGRLRKKPDKTMYQLLENPEKAPKVGMWVLEK